MSLRSIVQEQTRLALESVPGTAVAPVKRPLGFGLDLQFAAEFDEIAPMGMILPTDQAMRQEWSTFSVEGESYLDYNSIIYLLAGVIGAPVSSVSDGGTLAHDHLFTLSSTGQNTVQTFTIRKGTADSAEQAAYGLFTGMNLGFTRTARPSFGGDGIAQKIDESVVIGTNHVGLITITGVPEGGTFTVTVTVPGGSGQTTAGIAYNAIASAVTSALEALSNVASGELTATGSAGGPYTLTASGALADKLLTIAASGASLTGGTAPAATATVVQAGGPVEIDVEPVLAGQVSVYLDATAGALGTTKLLGEYAIDSSLTGRYEPEWVLDAARPSWKQHVLAKPDHGITLRLANDATARAFMSAVRNGTKKFLRVEANGPADGIESGQAHLFRLDACLNFNAVPSREAEGSASSLSYGARLAHDSTWGKGLQVLVRNGLAAL